MARRKTEVFSMSFLDCITCAFGSVVLVYVLINAQGGLRQSTETQAAARRSRRSWKSRCSRAIRTWSQLRNSMMQTEDEQVRTEGMGTRVLDRNRAPQGRAGRCRQGNAVATRSDRAAEGRSQVARGRHAAAGRREPGCERHRHARARLHRHRRPAISDRPARSAASTSCVLVDVSASMLDETVVNILRMRNMSETRKLMSEQVAAHALDRRLARGAAAAGSAVPDVCVQHQGLGAAGEGTDGKWLKVERPERAERCAAGVCTRSCRRTAPASRTRSSR